MKWPGVFRVDSWRELEARGELRVREGSVASSFRRRRSRQSGSPDQQETNPRNIKQQRLPQWAVKSHPHYEPVESAGCNHGETHQLPCPPTTKSRRIGDIAGELGSGSRQKSIPKVESFKKTN